MANARNAKSAREKAAEMRADTERTATRNRTIVAGLAVILVIVLAAFGTWGFRTLSDQKKASDAAKVAPPANVYTGVSKVGGGLLVGKGGAKVTVDIYEDFMCPICKEFEVADGPILRKYATDGKINLVYHPVAILDRASAGTRYSTRSANLMAAVLNSSPGSALALHDFLFENQPQEGGQGLPDEALLALAEKIGVKQDLIAANVKSLRFEGWVTTTTDKFTKVFPPGGTPTVAIDGQVFKDLEPAKLTAALDAAVKK